MKRFWIKACMGLIMISLTGCADAVEPINKPIRPSAQNNFYEQDESYNTDETADLDKTIGLDEVVDTDETKVNEDSEEIENLLDDKNINTMENDVDSEESKEIFNSSNAPKVVKNESEKVSGVIDEVEHETKKNTAPPQPNKNNSNVGYNDKKSWWFKRNADHLPPSAQQDINISQYGGYYLGDTNEKVIYLTFDEGYENGYTSQILDVLKEKDIHATFFVTKAYIKSEPELVNRMVAEGHIVGNHSVTHPEMTDKSDEEILWELNECAAYFKEITGEDMPLYFRPPAGVYSIRSLENTQDAGYKSIFWSFAYKDWEVDNQPGKTAAYNMVMDNYHNGSIMLLHAVSQSNTEALGDIIDGLQAEGYRFGSLDEL